MKDFFIFIVVCILLAMILLLAYRQPISYDGDKCKLIWDEVLSETQSIILLECKP